MKLNSFPGVKNVKQKLFMHNGEFFVFVKLKYTVGVYGSCMIDSSLSMLVKTIFYY